MQNLWISICKYFSYKISILNSPPPKKIKNLKLPDSKAKWKLNQSELVRERQDLILDKLHFYKDESWNVWKTKTAC